jgi:hypothetical protein
MRIEPIHSVDNKVFMVVSGYNKQMKLFWRVLNNFKKGEENEI